MALLDDAYVLVYYILITVSVNNTDKNRQKVWQYSIASSLDQHLVTHAGTVLAVIVNGYF